MKVVCELYRFQPDTNKIVLILGHEFPRFDQSQVLMVTNISTSTIIYQPQLTGKGGQLNSHELGYELLLDYDVSSMSEKDELQIILHINELTSTSSVDKQQHLVSKVRNAKEEELLFRILTTLDKIEKHMASMTDEVIDDLDLDIRRK